MKKRILTISLIVASLVLLVSVGFAGWVITQNTSANTDDGNFQAYTVEKNNLTVGNLSQTIIFGKPTGESLPSVTNHWLDVSSMDAQRLTAEFTISWSNNVPSSSPVTLNLTEEYYKLSAPTDSTQNGTVDSKLIGGPTYSIKTAVTGASCTSAGVVTLGSGSDYAKDTSITIVVTYAWGSCLSNDGTTNPYVYFNNVTKDSTSLTAYGSYLTALDIAEHALADLNTFVTTYGFRICVSKAA